MLNVSVVDAAAAPVAAAGFKEIQYSKKKTFSFVDYSAENFT